MSDPGRVAPGAPRPAWTAAVEVTPAQALRLVQGAFPRLAAQACTPLGSGWDNTAVLIDGTWVVRFPRRAPAAAWLRHECAALPLLQGRIGCPVPCPELQSEPREGFPYPFAGYRLLPGQPLCRRGPLTGAAGRALAHDLGSALARLHALPVAAAAAAGVPEDTWGRLEVARRAAAAAGAMAIAATLPGAPAAATLAQALAAAVTHARPPAGPVALVHGDLYVRHLLVDEHDRLAGIIDWGDVHRGDPAVDLAIVFSGIAPEDRDAFWTAYGAVDPPRRSLARARALVHALALAGYAQAQADADLIRACVQTLCWGVRAEGEG